MDFAAGDIQGRNALGEIITHIRTCHPNPHGPAFITFTFTTDSAIIEKYVEGQGISDVLACSYEGCEEFGADLAWAAFHWVEQHLHHVTSAEARQALEADLSRFQSVLATCFTEFAEEEARRREAIFEPDDGYIIIHSPSVPRVRSRPSEYIVYVDRETVQMSAREVEEMLESEGDETESELLGCVTWPDDLRRTARVELRFCNILCGYIPLVKEVRGILPPSRDNSITIETTWMDERGEYFTCKVNKQKRAIYNLDGKLKVLLRDVPSGTFLYITRIGARKYLFELRRRPHIVHNCKTFVRGENGDWAVIVNDQTVEWETSDHVFRHQLTFNQMEALYHEARTVNLSVRDAVYEVTKRLASEHPVHVKTVYDAVFLWMRTCSLASVWAQFRPEHRCYQRTNPGWYRFDATQPLPRVVVETRPTADRPKSLSRDFDERRNYVVRRRPDDLSTWNFQIYANRLNDYVHRADSCVVVVCDFGSASETVFAIPVAYLLRDIIPRAHCDEHDRYLFDVHKSDYRFNWRHGISMDGKRFLAP